MKQDKNNDLSRKSCLQMQLRRSPRFTWKPEHARKCTIFSLFVVSVCSRLVKDREKEKEMHKRKNIKRATEKRKFVNGKSEKYVVKSTGCELWFFLLVVCLLTIVQTFTKLPR